MQTRVPSYRRTADYVLKVIENSPHCRESIKKAVRAEMGRRESERKLGKFGPWRFNGLSSYDIEMLKSMRKGRIPGSVRTWKAITDGHKESISELAARGGYKKKKRYRKRGGNRRDYYRTKVIWVQGVEVRINGTEGRVQCCIFRAASLRIIILIRDKWGKSSEHLIHNQIDVIDSKIGKTRLKKFIENIWHYRDLDRYALYYTRALRLPEYERKAIIECIELSQPPAVEKYLSEYHKYGPDGQILKRVTLKDHFESFCTNNLKSILLSNNKIMENREILKVLKYAKKLYINYVEQGIYFGLCDIFFEAFKEKTNKDVCRYSDTVKYIPEFSPEFFGLKIHHGPYLKYSLNWWEITDTEPRIIAFDMLIEIYKQKVKSDGK